MRIPITTALVAIALMVGIVFPVQGGSISGTLSGDSTLTPTGTPGVYVQNFSGEGDDSTYSSFTPSSSSKIDFSNPPHILISDGNLSLSFSQGTWFGTTSGSGTGNGLGTATFTIDFLITGGTGLFAGATGEATITGTITTTSPTTESITGSYAGSLVPEPSSLVLLAPAVVIGAVVVVRGRRPPSRQLLFLRLL
jgi:hypothetical protein